jgi:hypothetical protein
MLAISIICDYGVGGKKKKLLKNIIKKRRLSIPFITNSKSKAILLK